MANVWSRSTGVAPGGVSIDDNRRIYNFGERVAELAPQQSPFLFILAKSLKNLLMTQYSSSLNSVISGNVEILY